MKAMVAPCGLNCADCDIYRAQGEPALMAGILEWFQRERGIRLQREQVRCGGCPGDRSIHWSADCELLRCCVDGRKLPSCAGCVDFPCPRLQAWAEGGKRYRDAFDRLMKLASS